VDFDLTIGEAKEAISSLSGEELGEFTKESVVVAIQKFVDMINELSAKHFVQVNYKLKVDVFDK